MHITITGVRLFVVQFSYVMHPDIVDICYKLHLSSSFVNDYDKKKLSQYVKIVVFFVPF